MNVVTEWPHLTAPLLLPLFIYSIIVNINNEVRKPRSLVVIYLPVIVMPFSKLRLKLDSNWFCCLLFQYCGHFLPKANNSSSFRYSPKSYRVFNIFNLKFKAIQIKHSDSAKVVGTLFTFITQANLYAPLCWIRTTVVEVVFFAHYGGIFAYKINHSTQKLRPHQA